MLLVMGAELMISARQQTAKELVLKLNLVNWVLVLLVAAMLSLKLSAQTQITAGQLPALQGAVQGNSNTTTLRDLNSAVDHETNMAGGITGAISACGTSITCSILIPPSYTKSEAVPGYNLDPNNVLPGTTMPGNITIFDQRYGDARMAVNPAGYTRWSDFFTERMGL